jgi:hypothetical protein
VVPAAAFVGGVLADTFKALLVDSVKDLLAKFSHRMRKKDIGDFQIKLPDGSTIIVAPDAKVTLSIQGGRKVSFDYDTPPTS